MALTFITEAQVGKTTAQIEAALLNYPEFAYRVSIDPEEWVLLVVSLDYIRGDNYAPFEVYVAYADALEAVGVHNFAYVTVPPVVPATGEVGPGFPIHLERPAPRTVTAWVPD